MSNFMVWLTLFLILGAFSLLVTDTASAQDKPKTTDAPPKAEAPTAEPKKHDHAAAPAAKVDPRFERIKSLAGKWKSTFGEGAEKFDGEVEYRVTAGGSAVLETLFPGTPHEMVTLYHMDGDDLMLTHYCGAGNQPRMKAAKSDKANVINFEFVSATNMKSEKDAHMHSAVFEFIDDNHVKTAWAFYDNGKQTELAKFDLQRVKP